MNHAQEDECNEAILQRVKHRYYVYALTDERGRKLYIGKGTGKRALQHFIGARAGWKERRYEGMRAVWARGGYIKVRILFTTNDEAQAYAREELEIARVGIDKLLNTRTRALGAGWSG